MSNKLLQNKSFIQWRLFPSEEDDLYWRAFIKDHPEMKNEIDEAIRVIKSIKLNTRKLTPEEKQDIFNLIRKDIEKRNRHKRNTVYIGISSSVACVALALLLLRVFVPVGEESFVLPEPVDIMRDSVVNAKEIRLILGDEKAITIENESDILYNTQGEVVINTSEEKIKAGKAATENFVLNTLIVPKGRHLNLTLSDGTKVWVNSGTTLKFPVEFDPGKREIWVDGEIYIEVEKNEKQPFYVNTSRMTVDVVGTRFDVSAYHEDETCSVVLVEGSVNVVVEGDKYYLSPAQMLTLTGDRISTRTVDVYDYISWTNGLLQFSREPLINILTRLSRYYDMDITCEEQVKDLLCNGKLVLFDNIEDVLRTIYNTIPIQYSIEGEHIKIVKR